MLRYALLLSVAVLLVDRPATAAPMVTSLRNVTSEAMTIVIGTMGAGPDLVVDVDTVLRGTSPLGPRKLKTSPDGASHASGRVVVLIDRNDTFRWVGNLVAGPSIETGVLRLSGFFDWNAHIVRPGMMTLSQLKTFMANGTLVQKLAATIMVEDGTGGFVSSGKVFTLDHDAIAGNTSVVGPSLKGACLESVSTRGLEWNMLRVTFTGTCPLPPGATGTEERRLELDAKLTGVDSTGAIVAEMTPRYPFLDFHDFQTFMKDTSIATIKRFINVSLSDGTKWTWDTSSGLIDPQGTPFPSHGISSQSFSMNGVTTSSQSYDFYGASIAFSTGTTSGMSTGDDAARLVPMIDANAYNACLFDETGKPERACILGRGHSQVVKR